MPSAADNDLLFATGVDSLAIAFITGGGAPPPDDDAEELPQDFPECLPGGPLSAPGPGPLARVGPLAKAPINPSRMGP